MYQQAPARQADETICFECGHVVKRGARLCPECGKRIAAEPQSVVVTPSHDPAKSSPHTVPSPHTMVQEDVVGVGRYIINFLLAGFIGLGLTFLLRRQGWLATWFCVPICILAAVYLIATGGPSP